MTEGKTGRDGPRSELVHAHRRQYLLLAKIGSTDGKSFQQMAGSMTGMTEDSTAP